MEEYQEHDHITQEENRDRWADIRASVNRPLVAAMVVLLVILGITAAYGFQQRAMVRDLTAQSAATAQSMTQLQSQVNTLNAQLQGVTQATQAQAQAQNAAAATEEPVPETPATVVETPVSPVAPARPAAQPAPAKRHSVKRRATVDKHYAELQAQLAEQQKELKDTQQQMEKYRSDMEGNINSTRNELSGSIAKNHDELVALEKRGERSYFEFELTKSKQFERVGPLSLSLRKADTKHKSYDLSMLVDDNELNKKKVNLYEPVTIHTDNESQPVQIVVNHIDKNLVHGYVSAPKYRPSELTPATAAAVSPATGTVPSAHDTSSSSGAQRQQ